MPKLCGDVLTREVCLTAASGSSGLALKAALHAAQCSLEHRAQESLGQAPQPSCTYF